MLNKLFEQEVQSAVGDEAFFDLKKKEAYRIALREFDTAIKLGFRGRNDSDKYVSFPMANLKDNPNRGLKKNAMVLSGYDALCTP